MKRIAWYEPRWSHLPKWRTDTAELWRARFWVRVALLTAVVLAPILLWMRATTPNLQIPWPQLFGGAASMAVIIVAQSLVMRFIPPRWEVRPGRIQYNHGQSGFIIKARDVLDLYIDATNPERPALVVRYRRKRERTRRAGIPPKTDLAALDQMCQRLLATRDRAPVSPQRTPA